MEYLIELLIFLLVPCFAQDIASAVCFQESEGNSQANRMLSGQDQITSANAVNNVLYVGGGVAVWPGSDIGAQISSAYAALPPSGGSIIVLPQTGGGCYSFSTSMKFNTNLKVVALEGLGPATCLQWTPKSGNAISLNWGGSHQGAPFMRNLAFYGSGAANTATGILITSASVTDQIDFDHVFTGSDGSTGGWGTFFNANGFGFDISMDHMGIINNATGVLLPPGSLIVRISNSEIAANTVAGVSMTGGAAGLVLVGDDIEPCISGTNNEVGVLMSGSGGVLLQGYGNHWEATAACTGVQFISSTASNARAEIYGGDFLLDLTTGTQTQLVTWKADTLILDGVSVATLGATLTEVVNFTNTFGRAMLRLQNTNSTVRAPYGGTPPLLFNASVDQTGTWTASTLATGAGSAVFATNPTFSQSMFVTESGECTMSSGTCPVQPLSHTYSTPPRCFGSWTGSGTLTGILKFPSTVKGVTPASSVGTDSAVVNWECHAANTSF